MNLFSVFECPFSHGAWGHSCISALSASDLSRTWGLYSRRLYVHEKISWRHQELHKIAEKMWEVHLLFPKTSVEKLLCVLTGSKIINRKLIGFLNFCQHTIPHFNVSLIYSNILTPTYRKNKIYSIWIRTVLHSFIVRSVCTYQ